VNTNAIGKIGNIHTIFGLEKMMTDAIYFDNKASYMPPVSSTGKHVPVKRKVMVELLETLGRNNDKCANGKNKRVGHLTQEKRKTTMMCFVADMNLLGYRLESLKNIREKHIYAWVEFLVKDMQMPSTIQNKLSVLRIFCGWIGKAGMVRSPEYYVDDASLVKRSTATKQDKSWSEEKVKKLIDVVTNKDLIVGMQLKLCDAFGLRRQEAIMLMPHVSDEGEFLHLYAGTKGGRPRLVPIASQKQRDVLEEAKAMADLKTGLICRPGKTLKQAINRFKYVMRYCGITKLAVGVTAHGLRHGYVHHRYEVRTDGGKLPIKGGKPGEVDTQLDKVAKMKVMEEVGHSRVSVTTAYGGSHGHAGRSNRHYAEITAEQTEAICKAIDNLEKYGLAGPGDDKNQSGPASA
jgi:integrase